MRTTAITALALLLAGCASDRSRVTASPTWAAADGGSDMSGAAMPVQTASGPSPTLPEPADADELAGGAECVTHDGAPYEAPTC